MILLIVGLILFLGSHSVRIVVDDFRNAQIVKFGLLGWKTIYSIISLAGFALIIYGYAEARLSPVLQWNPPRWTRYLAALLTVPAFILLAAAYVPGTRIKQAVGHPLVASVKIWAFAHLLANGTLANVLLFGTFLAWAVLDYISLRRRDRAAGIHYTVGSVSQDMTAMVVGLVAWAVFAFWLHGWLIGVRPLPG